MHKTSIFPCQIFQVTETINRKPEDPNYDLFKLALKSTSLRLYPNYSNTSWSGNAGYNPNDPRTYFSTMGCVDGKEIVSYKFHHIHYVESFERFWNRMAATFAVLLQPNLSDHYINLSDVKIFDSKENAFVDCYRIIRNRQSKWMEVTIDRRKIEVTDDHPFETENRGVVLARDLSTEDYILCDGSFTQPASKKKSEAKVLPVLKFEVLPDQSKYSYDVSIVTEHFTVSGIYSHNCRTANGWDINGLGQLKDGRGNICPVTIILPELAMKAKIKNPDQPVQVFMEILDQKIHEAKDMLIERFNFICSQDPRVASFMWENQIMAGYIPEEGIRSALKHGTLALGQLGLAEALQLLIGVDHVDPDGMKLAKRIESLFKTRCAEFKNQYKLNIGVYYSPSESLCYTALKKFREKYGVIPEVSDKEFFTNSMHVPVWKPMNPFEKIDIESQLTGYSSAGCITYVELDACVLNNLQALETLVNYAMDKDIPYFAVNVPNDTCNQCGYQGEFNDHCPQCGSKNIQQLRRVTGYLTGNYSTAFNPGKIDEVHHRVKHG